MTLTEHGYMLGWLKRRGKTISGHECTERDYSTTASILRTPYY